MGEGQWQKISTFEVCTLKGSLRELFTTFDLNRKPGPVSLVFALAATLEVERISDQR
jgi:hypothetical protein